MKTVAAFGEEWSAFDQSVLPVDEARRLFEGYFSLVPPDSLGPDCVALDAGCGSGRWAALLAPFVGTLHMVDASDEALGVARRNLAGTSNVVFHHAALDAMPLDDASVDFAYSLGVLHHLPDPRRGVSSLVAKLRPGGQLLLYLYYDFEDRPRWFRAVWAVSDVLRRCVCRLPRVPRRIVCDALAITVYWPLARFVGFVERVGGPWQHLPLAFYRDKSLYTMRTDSLDRFGTRVEKRFSKAAIRQMLEAAGLVDIRFREGEPFWVVAAVRPR